MAGRLLQPLPSRSKSLILLPLTVAFLIFLFSAVTSHPFAIASRSSSVAYSSSKPETSFLVSLKHFLARHRPTLREDTSRDIAGDAVVTKFDESMSKREVPKLQEDPHYPMVLPIRVYVYEMSRKFTYDLLNLFLNTYGGTTNLTSNGSPIHPLIEQGGKIRSKLVTELSGAKGVVIEEGTAGDSGKAAAQNGMRKSIFCLNPARDTPSSA